MALKKCPFCNDGNTNFEEGDKFCKKCGQELLFVSDSEDDNDDILESGSMDVDNAENTMELTSKNGSHIVTQKKENLLKRIFKGVGTGGLIAGGGFLYLSYIILQFLFVAFAGLSMIALAIALFRDGSIVWGLLALFIGTPLAIGLASSCFIFFLILAILAAIIWGVTHIFGLNISFANVWSSIWLIIKIVLLTVMTVAGIAGFISAVKEKSVISFLKETWFYAILYILILLFF
jgi:hypothetical protein